MSSIIDATDIVMSRRVQLRRERLSLHMTWIMTFNLMVAKRGTYTSHREQDSVVYILPGDIRWPDYI